jgi:hypothetical protein
MRARPRPPDAVVLECAASLANIALFTIDLQRRRTRSAEPEDDRFVMRWWADLQFLVVALWHLRHAATRAQRVTSARVALVPAVAAFDRALPGLARMRSVIEHVDDYAIDAGRDAEVSRASIEVGSWDGTTWRWSRIGELNVDVAFDAAKDLYRAVQAVAGPGNTPA